uniref:Uncharacterized protein n=1 Tax=Tanacetum cinerariifolium TaxID=118510 RepID=A0A699ISY8_TANCI|nr:hypothetical protein [Tanacetum cinerariifolium]
MDITINQQVALDEALVPHASQLRIGKNNFHLRSKITSKESTLQLVTTTVHRHSICFKMNNKKRIVNLEYFREMLHISPRLPDQTFDELSFEEEILAFLRYLGHNKEIRKLTDVNINKLHIPWRSFAAFINKYLSGKSTGYDNFLYQAEHKKAKKSNEMYYHRFIKVIIHFFMTKDPLIPRRNKNTQHFGAMLPVVLTNEDFRNSAAYKEYYAIASGAAPPKMKASVRKTHKRSLQYISQASGSGADEGTDIIPRVPDVPTDESDDKISRKSSVEDDDDDDEVDDKSDDQEDKDDQDDNDQDETKLSIHEE